MLRRRPEYAARQREVDRQRRQTPERQAWDKLRRMQPKFRAQRRHRYATDPAFALKVCSQVRIHNALTGKEKAARTLELLGVPSISFYQAHLEVQFEPGMTWENYGTAWHVDHRIPLSLLDLTKPEAQRFGFNYKNTRPMWADANRRRSNNLVFEDLL